MNSVYATSIAGLFVLVGACSAPSADSESSASSNLDGTSGPGSATLKFQAAHEGNLTLDAGSAFPPAVYEFVVSDGTTDEYLRDGESVTLAMTADALVGGNASDALNATLSADVAVTFYRAGGVTGTTTVKTGAFGAAGDPQARVAKTDPFTIPAGVDAISFLLTEHGAPQFEGFQLRTRNEAVIGAYVPNKLELFDTSGTGRRERTLEGGALVAGADTTVAYTDYRVETLLDSSTLDLRVADDRDAIDRGGDLGPSHPVYGTAAYEVWVATYDDVHGWSPETQLTMNYERLLLEASGASDTRFDFTGTTHVPANATTLQVYFHVKAFVQAPQGYGNNAVVRYAAGSKTFLREAFDNPSGAGTNYTFALAKP